MEFGLILLNCVSIALSLMAIWFVSKTMKRDQETLSCLLKIMEYNKEVISILEERISILEGEKNAYWH